MIKQYVDSIRRESQYKRVFRKWLKGEIPDNQLRADQRAYIQKTMKARMKRIKRRFRRQVELHMFLRNITVKPIGRLLRPLPVNWHEDFADGISYPHCPACDELAYQKDHCVFCGRRFSQWDATTGSGK